MKFSFHELDARHQRHLEETIVYPPETIARVVTLLGMDPVAVGCVLTKHEDIVHAVFHLETTLVLECAYTLKPVKYPLVIDEELDFCLDNRDFEEDGLLHVKNDRVDLDPWIFGLIVTEIPLRVVAPDAQLPSGKGYEIISEEEALAKKSNDPRLSKLEEWDES